MSADSQVTRHGDSSSYFFWSDGTTDAMSSIQVKNDRPNEVYLHKLWLYAPGTSKVVLAITRSATHAATGAPAVLAANASLGTGTADHRDSTTTGLTVIAYTTDPTITSEVTVLGRAAVVGPFNNAIPVFDFPGKAITIPAAGSLYIKVAVGAAAQLALWGEVSDF